MSKKRQHMPSHLATRYLQLAFASTETIAWRWWMMATGSCSPSEYALMVTEKLKASLETGAIMVSPRPSVAKLMAPWHRGARRNAKRLRGGR